MLFGNKAMQTNEKASAGGRFISILQDYAQQAIIKLTHFLILVTELGARRVVVVIRAPYGSFWVKKYWGTGFPVRVCLAEGTASWLWEKIHGHKTQIGGNI